MKITDRNAIALQSLAKTKMEDRKRSLIVDHDDAVQPSKRHATTANGAPVRMESDKEKEIEVGTLQRRRQR